MLRICLGIRKPQPSDPKISIKTNKPQHENLDTQIKAFLLQLGRHEKQRRGLPCVSQIRTREGEKPKKQNRTIGPPSFPFLASMMIELKGKLTVITEFYNVTEVGNSRPHRQIQIVLSISLYLNFSVTCAFSGTENTSLRLLGTNKIGLIFNFFNALLNQAQTEREKRRGGGNQ